MMTGSIEEYSYMLAEVARYKSVSRALRTNEDINIRDRDAL